MAQTDPVADLLSAVRNAVQRGYRRMAVPHSTHKEAVARALAREGFFSDVRVVDPEKGQPRKTLHVYFKYGPDGEPVLQSLRRVSKPGCRVFVGVRKIPKVLDGLGTCVLSTPHGVLTSREAQAKRTGGELICEAW